MKPSYQIWLRLGLALLCSLSLSVRAAESIDVITYHNHPPFITDEHSGFSQELVDALNKAAAGRYQFELRVLPRNRLNLYLEAWLDGRCSSSDSPCNGSWVLPWVNPLWGFAGAQAATAWVPLMEDENRLVFHQPHAVDIQALRGFDGLVMAGMRGHRYRGLDDLAAAGRLKRIDGNRERDNMIKVLMDRVDFTLLPMSTVQHFLQEDPFLSARAGEFLLPDPPQQRYTRFAVVPKDREALRQLVAQVAERLSARWQGGQAIQAAN